MKRTNRSEIEGRHFTAWNFGAIKRSQVDARIVNRRGHLCDPITHKLGANLLSSNLLESSWAYLYQLPLVPWTRFNNTVVCGNLALALIIYQLLWLIRGTRSVQILSGLFSIGWLASKIAGYFIASP